jgi:hypothetical protein
MVPKDARARSGMESHWIHEFTDGARNPIWRTSFGTNSTLEAAQMGCLVVILLLAFPRIALVLMFLFSDYLQRAYHGLLIPLLGFIFLPLTTLVFAWMTNTHQPLAGINLIILLVTVIVDLGSLGGGDYHRRSRW